MLPVPDNWNDYWRNGECRVGTRLDIHFNDAIGLVKTFTNADLKSCTLEARASDSFSIGNAFSAHLAFEVFEAMNYVESFSKGQRVDFSVRLELGDDATDYVAQGVYYIDDFTTSDDGSLSVSAYDEMQNYEGAFIAKDTELSGSTVIFSDLLALYTAKNVINADFSSFLNTRIERNLYSSVSSATTIGNMTIPADAIWLDLRTMLESVAAIAGGNVFISKTNAVTLYRNSDNVGTALYSDSNYFPSFSTAERIRFGASYVYATGLDANDLLSGSGWLIKSHIDKTFSIKREQLYNAVLNMYARYHAPRKKSFEASGVSLNPVMELGNKVYFSLGIKYRGFNVYRWLTVEHYAVNYLGDCYGSISSDVSENDSVYAEFIVHTPPTFYPYGWRDAFWTSDGVNDNLWVNSSGQQPLTPQITGSYTFMLECRVDAGNGNSIARVTGAEHIDGTISCSDSSGSFDVTIDANLRRTIWPIHSTLEGNTYNYVYLVYDNKYEFPSTLIGGSWERTGQVNSSSIVFKKPGSNATGQEVLVEDGVNFRYGDETPPKSEITQVAYGGTGQASTETNTTISNIATAESGVTVGIAKCSKWGKVATLYMRCTPSTAKSGNWVAATLKEGYRPAIESGFVTSAQSVIGYILEDGTVHFIGSVSAGNNIYAKATYVLA